MSFLIKGMRLPPKGEYNATIYVCHDGEVYIAFDSAEMDEYADYDGKCDLIEVSPHGRLIDSDAINYEDEIWKKKCIPPLMVYNAWLIAGEMPTIIESEEEKPNG